MRATSSSVTWLVIAHLCFLSCQPKLALTNEVKAFQNQKMRWVRSNAVPTDLEVVLSTLSQRMDTMEAETRAMKNDVQLLGNEQQHLQQDIHLLGYYGTQQGPSMPPSTTPDSPDSPSTTATGVENLLLPTLRNELQQLKVKVSEADSTLTAEEELRQSYQQNYSASHTHLEYKLNATNIKYNFVEEILGHIRAQGQATRSNMTSLQDQDTSLQSLMGLLDSAATATFTNLSEAISNAENAVYTLMDRFRGSATVAFEVIGDAAERQSSWGDPILFPHSVAREWVAYDSSTGHVTVHVAGWYLFLLKVGVKAENCHGIQLMLQKNGQSAASTEAVTIDNHTAFFTLQVLLHVSVHDNIWPSFSAPHDDRTYSLLPQYASTFIGVLVG